MANQPLGFVMTKGLGKCLTPKRFGQHGYVPVSSVHDRLQEFDSRGTPNKLHSWFPATLTCSYLWRIALRVLEAMS